MCRQITTMYVADNRKDYKAKLVELLLKSVDGARETTYGSVSINLAPFCTFPMAHPTHVNLTMSLSPRSAPSRGSTGLAGVSTRPAGLPHPWGATSCRKAAPPTCCLSHQCGIHNRALSVCLRD